MDNLRNKKGKIIGILILGLLIFCLIFVLSGSVNAYSGGEGVCYCGNSTYNYILNCDDCNSAISNTSCSEVRLNASISDYNETNAPCIKIQINNKIFNCEGHTIDGLNKPDDSWGIYVTSLNNTIRNCVVTDFWFGIELGYFSKNNTLTGNAVKSNKYGIRISQSSNNSISNNNVSSNEYEGIQVTYYSDNNIITNNIANLNGRNGIYLENNSNFNTVNSNTFCYNNQSKGNFSDIKDEDSNTGDDNACNTTLNWNDAGAGLGGGCKYDCAATTCYCSNCSDCISKLNNVSCLTVNLLANITNQSGNCIDNPENFTYKTFDCKGYTIGGNNTNNTYGIYLNGKEKDTIRNCTITGFDIGIILNFSNNNTLTNNKLDSNNKSGIYLLGDSNSNNILNNEILNNSLGVTMSDYFMGSYYGGNANNNLQGNEISNNTVGIYSQNSNSTINSNVVCGNTNLDFNSSGWLSSSGNSNLCDNNDGWNDNGIESCRYTCSGLPRICDLNKDGIVIHDWNNLMIAYKCFLGINQDCKISYQDWNIMRLEYNCFVRNFN